MKTNQTLSVLFEEIDEWKSHQLSDQVSLTGSSWKFFYKENNDSEEFRLSQSQFDGDDNYSDGSFWPRAGIYTARCYSQAGLILFDSTGTRLSNPKRLTR